MKPLLLFLSILAALGSFAHGARVETRRAYTVALSSGSLSNLTDQPEEKVIGVLTASGASRVRVVVAKAVLGASSKIRFVSEKDEQSQTLDEAQLAMWSGTSALFNGPNVRLEVVVAPGDRNVSVQVDQVIGFTDEPDASQGDQPQPREGSPETLCGGDERVAAPNGSYDAAGTGRLLSNGSQCTAWLVSNGGVLTAGHCGVVPGAILEFNVPASLANGTTVAAAVRDQYPALANSITSVDGGVGNDWSVFRIGRNNLQESAHERQGFKRMTRELPAAGAVTRITGCGVDNTPQGSEPDVCGAMSGGTCTHFGLNAQNRTLQTSSGPFVSENAGGGAIWLRYSVDTEPANSGSPVIWEANGFTIGIHTAGGCTSSGGANNGTSFELDALENAIAAVPGGNCRYLDFVKAPGGAEDGTVFQPHDTLVEAVNAVPVGGRLSVVAGNYFVTGVTLNKAMTISAPVGPVRLGN